MKPCKAYSDKSALIINEQQQQRLYLLSKHGKEDVTERT